MLKFDLQLFDDEEIVSTAEENSESETQTEQADLPEGFEGLEEFKDEILAEVKGTQESQETSSSDESTAGQKVPYERFKSKVDEVAALKAQIDEMKRQGVQGTQTPKPRQPPQNPQQPLQMPQIQVTPEFMSTVKNATKNLAMQMANFTPEQVKQIEEYGEEGDADFERWQYAKQFAAQSVHAEIEKIRTQQARQAQTFLNEHTAAVHSYNDFAEKEMSAPEFQEVVKFATGEYFDSLPENVQRTIANSYVKIERQTASPAEVLLVQNFYTNAKTAFYNKNSQNSNRRVNPASKTKFPKADNLNGANGNGVKAMTAADLERLIDETEDFDSLDPKIKKMFEW